MSTIYDDDFETGEWPAREQSRTPECQKERASVSRSPAPFEKPKTVDVDAFTSPRFDDPDMADL